MIKDFYSVLLPDGSTSDFFERAFSEIEGSASAALALVAEGTWPLAQVHREALSAWVALQHLRGEEPRASQTQMSGEFIRLVVGASGKEALRRHIESAEGREISDDELDREWVDLTKPGGPDLEDDVMEHIHTLISIWPGMSAYLADSHWTLFRFSRRGLITSDHSVTMAVGEDYPSFYGVGIVTADLFLIPLSRRLALSIQPRLRLKEFVDDVESVPDFDVQGTTSAANSINQQTVRGARRYVYMHPDDMLDPRIVLPKPTKGSRMQISNTDSVIREEGLFANVESGNSPPASAETDKGVSLADLPWPIPNRKHS